MVKGLCSSQVVQPITLEFSDSLFMPQLDGTPRQGPRLVCVCALMPSPGPGMEETRVDVHQINFPHLPSTLYPLELLEILPSLPAIPLPPSCL